MTDSQLVAKVLQGLLSGWLMTQINNEESLLRIKKVDVPTDPDGNYENYIVVTFESGRQIAVTVENYNEMH